jgi:hypothetical protein
LLGPIRANQARGYLDNFKISAASKLSNSTILTNTKEDSSTMALWLCDWVDCQKPAVQRAGDCPLCERHLCRTHLQDTWHTCPKPEVSISCRASSRDHAMVTILHPLTTSATGIRTAQRTWRQKPARWRLSALESTVRNSARARRERGEGFLAKLTCRPAACLP